MDDQSSVRIEMDKLKIVPASKNERIRSRNSSPARNTELADSDAEHFLDPNSKRSKPPVANPETDDDDELDIDPTTPQPGVDDGFFPPPKTDTDNNRENGFFPSNGVVPRRRPSFAPSENPNYPGFGGGTVVINGVTTPIPDYNMYQQKKTLAQGMMDLALLSANANQLRYVLESFNRHPYYYPSVIFISLSIFFQIAVGIGLIINSRYNVVNKKEICKANRINNFTVIGVFIVTVVNVFISAFGVASPETNT